MKGFGIYVKNNLLEPKHIEAMGDSVWLYMWLLDKMTSINENGIGRVSGGAPVLFENVSRELGLSQRTYQRWVARLRDSGYIRTLRTPYGLVITVNKAEKIYGTRSAKSGGSKVLSNPPKVAARSAINGAAPATNGTSNKDNTEDNTITSTDVLEPPVRYGDPKINEIFDYWAEEVGYNIETRVKANRAAASNLLKKYGADKLTQLIKGVAATQSDQYAPTIGDFCQLQQKLPSLMAWGKKKYGAGAGRVLEV